MITAGRRAALRRLAASVPDNECNDLRDGLLDVLDELEAAEAKAAATPEELIDAAMAVRSPGDGTDPVSELAVAYRETSRLADLRLERLLQKIAENVALREQIQRESELRKAFEGAAADLAMAGVAERNALRKVVAIQSAALDGDQPKPGEQS